ncbi:ATP-dependent transcriptional regulator [Flavobacterium hibernum]|uniref:MalT-like TPR region domain-containing protein n=1 Tax=Flavobacterium hibernum TaxID=37752 RepID=A0ABX4CE74_9FLAO|nr:hypothetical protein B0A73_00975 [Flavobacterium hibernum]STO19038.1 ATP-dependent transcriptional regulator [Flavobacterium hibernum]
MLLKKTYCIFLLFFVFQLKAQNAQIRVSSFEINSKNFEAILEQEKSFDTDTIALKNYLQPLTKNKYYSVFYEALLANGYSDFYNSLNNKSDFYYLQSIKKAKLLNELNIEIWTQLNYVSYLYHYRNYIQMTPVLLKVLDQIEKLTSEKIIQPGESFKKIGWIMQTLGDYKESTYYLNLAKKHTSRKTAEYASILDNIGINYLNTLDLKNAESYFLQTATLAKQVQDEVRYAKALGNLAVVKQKKGDFKTAISLVKKDISISKSQKSDQNTMYASILLAELYVADKNFEEAIQVLNDAQDIARSKQYFEKSELQIIQIQLEILQKQGKTDNELMLRRRMLILQDSLETKDGDMAINKSNWMIQKTKFQQNINRTKAQYKHETSVKNIYAIITILAFVLLITLYFIFKKHLKKRQFEYKQNVTSLKTEKFKSEQKLSEVNENLNSHVAYLKDKNNQIKRLKHEIEQIKQSPSHSLEKGNLSTLLESHLMTDENWNSFKREFQKEYPEFYRLLEEDFPEITDSNKRILLLQKLQFNNTEIAELLGITTEAVKKSKQRLKKKLGDKFDLLFEHISSKTL